MALSLDTQAPDFELSGTAQMAVKLSDYRGKKNVVLTFYEVAFNEDDTLHVEGFRDLEPEFEAANAQILAVSLDPVGIASAFAATSNIDYPLLSDHMDHAVCISYDAWRTDRGYAAKDGGGMARRITYVIDKQGRIKGLVPDTVPAEKQAKAALDLVKRL
jgi:peroxiredoxin